MTLTANIVTQLTHGAVITRHSKLGAGYNVETSLHIVYCILPELSTGNSTWGKKNNPAWILDNQTNKK